MLEWNVFVSDFNHKEIKTFNVFDHWRFLEDCTKNAQKNSKDFAAFADRLYRDLGYYFGSKCEWEVIITDWPTSGKCETKIDVHDQVMLNWEQFCNYVWSHGVELRRLRTHQKITREDVLKLIEQVERGEPK